MTKREMEQVSAIIQIAKTNSRVCEKCKLCDKCFFAFECLSNKFSCYVPKERTILDAMEENYFKKLLTERGLSDIISL